MTVFAAVRYEPDRTLALTGEPLECAVCHGMRCCFVNRDGRTRCFECDRAYTAAGLARLQTRAIGGEGRRAAFAKWLEEG